MYIDTPPEGPHMHVIITAFMKIASLQKGVAVVVAVAVVVVVVVNRHDVP